MDGRGCASVVEQNIASCPISILSLRDNALDHNLTKILPVLSQLCYLKCLDLGGSNFIGLKSNKKYSSSLSKVLAELADLISNQESVCFILF